MGVARMGNSFSAVDVISCCERCDASRSTSTPDLLTSANSFLDSPRKTRSNAAFSTTVPGEAAWQPDAEVDKVHDDQNSYGPGLAIIFLPLVVLGQCITVT